MVTIHEPTSTDFGSLGLGTLSPTSAIVTEELNGQYELVLEHPYDNAGKWQRIIAGNIICVPTPNGIQPFRIYRVKPTLEKITVNAKHIFYDLLDVLCSRVSYSGVATGALTAIQSTMSYPMPFTFYTNIVSVGVINVTNVNVVQALISEDASFAASYSGELLRDGLTVKILDTIGVDNGVTIRYGKNLTGLEVTEDYSNIKTRVVAVRKTYYIEHKDIDGGVWYTTIPEFRVVLDTPSINQYPYAKEYYVEYDDRASESVVIQRARDIVDSGIDAPSVNIKVDFVNLADTVEYADIKGLEVIKLGDVVTVSNSMIGFSRKSKVISYSYDSLAGRYNTIELGDFVPSLTGAVSNSTSAIQTVDGISTESKLIMSLISNNVVNILGESIIISMDNKDYMQATKLIRLGSNGIEYTSTGVNGTWHPIVGTDGLIPQSRIK